jgi:galactose-1-phosphate uridylyltransferase
METKKQQLSREALATILQAARLENLSFPGLVNLFEAEEGLANYIPDGICQIDPRNGERIIYNTARSRRPHDNYPADAEHEATAPEDHKCVVCRGQTTGVIDVADLSEGFTFINKNLFPILFPSKPEESAAVGAQGRPAHGLHFLQWTSSLHSRDWHNMPRPDRRVVLKRLAALEEKLLTGTVAEMSSALLSGTETGQPGFVSIIKNQGRLVGGSLAHGHQQIALSNVMPRRIENNRRFQQEHGEPFAAYLLRENPSDLLIRDYGPAVLLVPYFMRRPFDMLLLLKDTGKRYLHQLNEAELTAVADGWHDAIRAMEWLMPRLGREIAYNVVTNNGPGAGLYFEFLPYTQETGGFEHLGLFVCQANPRQCAVQIRIAVAGPAAVHL